MLILDRQGNWVCGWSGFAFDDALWQRLRARGDQTKAHLLAALLLLRTRQRRARSRHWEVSALGHWSEVSCIYALVILAASTAAVGRVVALWGQIKLKSIWKFVECKKSHKTSFHAVFLWNCHRRAQPHDDGRRQYIWFIGNQNHTGTRRCKKLVPGRCVSK